jgi:hypothetical protein
LRGGWSAFFTEPHSFEYHDVGVGVCLGVASGAGLLLPMMT